MRLHVNIGVASSTVNMADHVADYEMQGLENITVGTSIKKYKKSS